MIQWQTFVASLFVWFINKYYNYEHDSHFYMANLHDVMRYAPKPHSRNVCVIKKRSGKYRPVYSTSTPRNSHDTSRGTSIDVSHKWQGAVCHRLISYCKILVFAEDILISTMARSSYRSAIDCGSKPSEDGNLNDCQAL